jgi:hypothetical protein
MSALPPKADIAERGTLARLHSITSSATGRSGIAALHASCIRKRRPSTQNRIAAGHVAALASTLAQTVITGEIVDAATGPHVVVITGALTTVPVLAGIKRRYCRIPALRVRH